MKKIAKSAEKSAKKSRGEQSNFHKEEEEN